MGNLRVIFLVMLFAAVAAHPIAAQVLGPIFPAPGGTNWVFSGDPTTGTGTTTYTGINPAAFNQLWWGEMSVSNVCSPQTTCNTGNMNFSGYNPGTGIATWISSTNWTFTSGITGNPVSVPAEFQLQLGPTGITEPQLSADGLPAPLGVALPVTGTGFQVSYSWLACPPASPCESIAQYFSDNHGGQPQGFQTNSDGEFFYTSATPEPASFLLMGSGLLALGGVLRRRMFPKACAS